MYEQGKGAKWSEGIEERVAAEAESGGALEGEVGSAWNAAAGEAGAARSKPVGVSRSAHQLVGEELPATAGEEPRTEEEEEDESRWKDWEARDARFGRRFGTVVHRALELCIRDGDMAAGDAVNQAIGEVGWGQHRDEAVADVERGLSGLKREGLLGEVGGSLRVEYPVSGLGENGEVLLGYVDLVRVEGDMVRAIDFKTDQPPVGPVEVELRGYVEQVRMYGRLLREGGAGGAGGAGEVRCGLLFTGDGKVRWV